MVKQNVCLDCDVEFRVKHEAEENIHTVQFCPFCGCEITPDEEYELGEEEEDE